MSVYFWRETDPELGFLSQWYYCPFRDEAGIIYPTAEHYMMYQKAMLFGDEAIGQEILAADHPRAVKGLGRKVQGFDEKTWVANRERIVREGNMLKFTKAVTEESFDKGFAGPPTDGSLKAMLLATGSRELVEASPRDRIWGVGYGKNASENRANWGLNLLGKALMEVRQTLRDLSSDDKLNRRCVTANSYSER